MIIYNVTLKVDWAIHDKWLVWMQQEHIPEVLQTNCFFRHQIMQLLETDETDGKTYAIQYHALAMDDYRRYIDQYAAVLRQKVQDKWGTGIVAFRSVMEVLH